MSTVRHRCLGVSPGRADAAATPVRADDGLLHPAVGGAHLVRHAPHRPVHQAVRGPDHLPRHPDLRRDRQCRDGPAALPAADGRRARHRDLHQLTRWLVHRADRDLRHDALHQAGRPHGVPRAGRLGRRGDPGRRHQGQATRPAEQPDPDPPAGDRGRLRAVLRHRDPGPGDPADPVADGGDAGDRHRQDAPKRSAATSSATST